MRARGTAFMVRTPSTALALSADHIKCRRRIIDMASTAKTAQITEWHQKKYHRDGFGAGGRRGAQPRNADQSVWIAYGRKAVCANEFRTWIPTADRKYTSRELPGLEYSQPWPASCQVFAVTAIALELVSQAALPKHQEAHSFVAIGMALLMPAVQNASSGSDGPSLRLHERTRLPPSDLGPRWLTTVWKFKAQLLRRIPAWITQPSGPRLRLAGRLRIWATTAPKGVCM